MTSSERLPGHTVEIILGSKTDDDQTFADAKITETLDACGISWGISYISAHRNAKTLREFIATAVLDGTKIFIAAASMAAHLPGSIAAACLGVNRHCPVIGVALETNPPFLGGLDALFAETRMPPGVPICAAGIGVAGLRNAAIIAAQILAVSDQEVRRKLEAYMQQNTKPPQVHVRCSSPATVPATGAK